MKYGCYIYKGDAKGATFRATYIIDPKGIIRHISMNDTPVGRSVDEVMRLVQISSSNAETRIQFSKVVDKLMKASEFK